MSTLNSMHLLKQTKAKIFSIWIVLMTALAMSYKSRLIADSLLNLSRTGCLKIVSVALIAVKIAKVHKLVSMELKALIFRLPIQLLSIVQ